MTNQAENVVLLSCMDWTANEKWCFIQVEIGYSFGIL
jgi:hypothetical protein